MPENIVHIRAPEQPSHFCGDILVFDLLCLLRGLPPCACCGPSGSAKVQRAGTIPHLKGADSGTCKMASGVP
eukprot:8554289-Alexandrium_andersonii.AAC.1